MISNKKEPFGCTSCGTSSCNKVNVFDWLADIPEVEISKEKNFIEVAFQSGNRKEYFLNDLKINLKNGDLAAVQSANGFDIGVVSLAGFLVSYQMTKKKIEIKKEEIKKVLRQANTEDLKKWAEKPNREKEILIKSRSIIKALNLEMKLSTVEMQADGKKCTFYFIAEDRVDFRELIRSLVTEFKLKVEMKQIGARQEAGLVGGVGSCGRELCCSGFLKEFKSINTTVARYQNLSINQVKLSGQCGRLKCCLNYELDHYVETINLFPKHAEHIKTNNGDGKMIKKDIFKKTLTYFFSENSVYKTFTLLEIEQILASNKKGISYTTVAESVKTKDNNVAKNNSGFDNVESIKLADLKKRSKNKNKKNIHYSNRPNSKPTTQV